jgi:thiol-disulfide isomerase/thioredoxin
MSFIMKTFPISLTPNFSGVKKARAGLVSVLTVFGLLVVSADAATLKAGDPAPKLKPGKWLQGDPVKDFEKGKAYIVEFWATWCPPCRASIPHLNEIHKKYKDKNLVVIGQDCSERDQSQVEPFVKKMGDKMTYRVALDDQEGTMGKTWLQAADAQGIPTAFLVDTKGTVAWIGHPLQIQDKMIEDVLAGKFDPKKAAEQAKRDQEAMAKIEQAFRKQDWAAAEAAVADAEKVLSPEDAKGLDGVRLSILFAKKDYPAAYKLANQISETHKDDPVLQNEMAWRIANDKQIENRDLGVAETIATRANDASKGQEPAVLDTLARIKFMRGKTNEAVQLEEKAYTLADANIQPEIKKILDGLKKGELPKQD